MQDTGKEGHSIFQGRRYGQAEIALRDALMAASGMEDGYTLEAEQRQLANEATSLEEGYAAKAKAERA